MVLSIAAFAAPVACDPAAAAAIVEEARIDRRRVPFSHPELIPGLALADPDAPPALREALGVACAGEGSLSIRLEDRYEGPGWTAHAFALTRSTSDTCATVTATTLLSVATRDDGTVLWRHLAERPAEVAPHPGCDQGARWNEPAQVVDTVGAASLRVLRACATGGGAAGKRCPGGVVVDEVLVARLASADGWHEQVLAAPAPPSVTSPEDPFAPGARWEVVQTDVAPDGDLPWVVAHHDRTFQDGRCTPHPGPTVWRWRGEWIPTGGREALGLLGRAGLSRMSDQPGWWLVISQDWVTERRRFQAWQQAWPSSYGGPVYEVESVLLPRFNAGHVVLVADPWPDDDDAFAALRALTPRGRAYVKPGWDVVDACAARPQRPRRRDLAPTGGRAR